MENMKEKLLKCPHCPCYFCTEVDLKRRMDAFGNDPQEHLRNWRETHRRIERYGGG